MSTTRSFDDGEADHGLDVMVTLLAELLHQDLAGEAVAAVDAHGVGAADAVGAGATVGQRAVEMPFTLRHVEDAIGRFRAGTGTLERLTSGRPGCSA